MRSRCKLLLTLLVTGLLSFSILAQSGVRPNANAAGGVMVSVVARRDNKQNSPIRVALRRRVFGKRSTIEPGARISLVR